MSFNSFGCWHDFNGRIVFLYFLLGTLFTVTPLIAFCQTTLLPFDSSWKYLDNGSDQGTAWRAIGFNDSGWANGTGPLGYGYPGISTSINECATTPTCSARYITTYFRKSINISDVSLFPNFLFDMYRDDGVVIYINGTEVYRNGMVSYPYPTPIIYTHLASPSVSNNSDAYHTITLSSAASLLVSGNNTIAVEVHQSSSTSSDVIWDMKLVGMPITPIIRGPYLQKATSSSIVLRWRTQTAVDSKIMYGTSVGNLAESVVVSESRTEHTVQLTGLTPDTKYYYSVGTTSGPIQSGPDYYFLTSPNRGATGKYRFWVVGDAGTNTNTTNQLNVRNQYYNYVGSNITNGWLLLGDNAYTNGNDAEYSSRFFNIYQDNILKNSPLWPIAGNHEYYEGSESSNRQNPDLIAYYSIFDLPTHAEAGGVASGKEYFYSYDYGNIHFVALDSWCTGVNSAIRLDEKNSQQVAWLKQDLAANTLPWTIVYFHHPPYSKGSHDSDTEYTMLKIREDINPILESYGVDLVMGGHSHDYERSRIMKGHYGNEATFNSSYNLSSSSGYYDGSTDSCPYVKATNRSDGTVYVVAGSAGSLDAANELKPGYPHNALPFATASFGGSLIIEVEDNRLDAKFLNANGLIWDKFSIMKNTNKINSITINEGESAILKASWVGQYNWVNLGETTKNVNVTPATGLYTYIVKDQFNCIEDKFNVTVLPPLPVELISFKARSEDDKVVLTWKTASELNNDFFEVQRFTNPEVIEPIIKVQGKGTTSQEHSYQYEDFSPISGRSYYRLKQVDFDGKYNYSNIISATFDGNFSITLHPNPGDGKTLGLFTKNYDGPLWISILDSKGLPFYSLNTHATAGPNPIFIKLDTPLAAGLYFIRIRTNTSSMTRKWVVK